MQLISAPLPALTGIAGLAQGHYGTAGNLELVAPGADGGLWVFWFNADAVDRRSGAAAGEWSGGLHFAGPAPVAAARITQLDAGPDFLEVVALTGSDARRHCWTPAGGFTDRGAVASTVSARSECAEAGGDLHLLTVDATGTVRRHRASLEDYPDLSWRTTEPLIGDAASVSLAPDADRAAVVTTTGECRVVDLAAGTQLTLARTWRQATCLRDEVLGLDAAGMLAGTGPWQAVTAAATTLDGGRVDVVAARDEQLFHGHRHDGVWSDFTPIRSRVWVDDPGAPVHRR